MYFHYSVFIGKYRPMREHRYICNLEGTRRNPEAKKGQAASAEYQMAKEHVEALMHGGSEKLTKERVQSIRNTRGWIDIFYEQ